MACCCGLELLLFLLPGVVAFSRCGLVLLWPGDVDWCCCGLVLLPVGVVVACCGCCGLVLLLWPDDVVAFGVVFVVLSVSVRLLL